MTVFRPITALPIAIAVFAIALVGCGGGGETVTETVSGTTVQTETVAEPADVEGATEALSGVIERDLTDPGYRVAGYREDSALTEALLAKIDELEGDALAEGLSGLDFDPFLCAQQVPEDVRYEPARVADEVITINGQLDFGEAEPVEVTYGMLLEDGQWKLDSTDCVEQALAPK